MCVPRLNDIDRATNAKSEVEQKQRDEAKGRKDTNADWETKVTHNSANNVYQRKRGNLFVPNPYVSQYFKPVGDGWIYTKSLTQRLLDEKR